MTGLELAEKYYREVGKPMLEREMPEVLPRLAAGLVGHGSECYGFDDAFSRDHDFGPSFCLWLTREDYVRYGEKLERCYQKMPTEFAGFGAREVTAQGQGRVGVLILEDFYANLTGMEEAPGQIADWLMLSETGLAAAVNGKVFEDSLGEFSRRRKTFLAYYPEEIRRRKMAQAAVLASQSGQYNYARMMRRGDETAAVMAEHVFMEQAMQLVYLLNRRYQPFYKWVHRGISRLPRLRDLSDYFAQLAGLPSQLEHWKTGQREERYGLNLADEKVVCMETICALLVREMHEQGISKVQDNYLEAHVGDILK